MEQKFNQQQSGETEQASATRSDLKESLEFATTEEALRRDRAENPPPPEIAERLNQSLAGEPKRGTSFWTRLGFRK